MLTETVNLEGKDILGEELKKLKAKQAQLDRLIELNSNR